ncbi:hypothetical protein ElyMa_006631000 [Elysia marginata]|uniref:Uncharacterized protein n=1 Tax=Elysia marginata TaxID=1093978 RepID=A0AAV4IKE0_9GAST|nr:hypothetical protein ElyMa_006631000 [Elysia marginata]
MLMMMMRINNIKYELLMTWMQEKHMILAGNDKDELKSLLTHIIVHFPPARASPSLPFPSPAFRQLVPRPASPSPLQFSAGSCLTQPPLPLSCLPPARGLPSLLFLLLHL